MENIIEGVSAVFEMLIIGSKSMLKMPIFQVVIGLSIVGAIVDRITRRRHR